MLKAKTEKRKGDEKSWDVENGNVSTARGMTLAKNVTARTMKTALPPTKAMQSLTPKYIIPVFILRQGKGKVK